MPDALGSLLGVFAHPDDEAYLAGALMARAADTGRRVVCVTATRGELGFPEDDPRSVGDRMAVREAELASCLAELGVVEHHWLGHPDGGCASVPDHEPVARLAALIDEVRPDTVLTFGPDGQTLHPDHISVSRWTTLAVRVADHDPRLLYAAMTPEWLALAGSIVPLDEVMMVPGADPEVVDPSELAVSFVAEGDLLERKVRALRHQHSQVAGLVEQVGVETFARFVADETFRHPRPDDWPT
jgi:LmbE family N-acetylglucosaminyl deacetylase